MHVLGAPGGSLDERAREAAVESYGILEAGAEDAFQAIASLASDVCGAPFALVTLIYGDRQLVKGQVGGGSFDMPREQSVCAHAIEATDPVFVVEDLSADVRSASAPFVAGEPHLRFYAGVPLRSPEGYALGALCVIDREVRSLDDAHRTALRTLAKQVEAQFELRRYALERTRRAAAGPSEAAAPFRAAAADRDELTGLPSHRLFDERTERALADARSGARGAAILSLDLDRFAAVNESLGREAGDRLLAVVATRLQRQLRRATSSLACGAINSRSCSTGSGAFASRSSSRDASSRASTSRSRSARSATSSWRRASASSSSIRSSPPQPTSGARPRSRWVVPRRSENTGFTRSTARRTCARSTICSSKRTSAKRSRATSSNSSTNRSWRSRAARSTDSKRYSVGGIRRAGS